MPSSRSRAAGVVLGLPLAAMSLVLLCAVAALIRPIGAAPAPERHTGFAQLIQGADSSASSKIGARDGVGSVGFAQRGSAHGQAQFSIDPNDD